MTQDGREAGSRPGWRGPGLTKTHKGPQKPKASKATDNKTSSSSTTEELRVPVQLQQQILNVFKHTFQSLAEGGADALKPLLQEVKQALFDRDFERAFGRPDYLEVYAFRWSPSRSLCYLSILVDLQDHLDETLLFSAVKNGTHLSVDEGSSGNAGLSSPKPHHIACLGGGAAEVVAFGGHLKHLMQNLSQSAQDVKDAQATEAMGSMTISGNPPSTKLGILLIDTATWGDVIHKLNSTLRTPPPLSKYASASAKASNAPLLPVGTLDATFQRDNLLSMSTSQLKDSFGQQPLLITLLFTLNELYTSSIAQTTAFLLNLTAAVAQGTVLLVVDSPGSYSEATVGKDKKKYPMRWLMDRTLLGEQKEKGEADGPEWEKPVADESRWFRMPEELKYPISLENMRYQIHLFRRL
jgi:25S rRNA (uracil2843-N3)-methyltransferase